MSAPVPFVGFTGFKTPREVTQVLDSYTLSAGGNPAFGGRRILIGVNRFTLGDAARAVLEAASARPERVLRLTEHAGETLASAKSLKEAQKASRPFSDGILTGHIGAWPKPLMKVAGRRIVRVTLVPAINSALRALLLKQLETFRAAATDFVVSPLPEAASISDEDVQMLEALRRSFGETHGLGIEMKLNHESVVALSPLWAPERFPNLSLLMRLPRDKDGDGDDVEARYILRNVFGMTFSRRR